MRDIKFLVVHCTASQPNQKTQTILNYWKNVLKWKSVGYHIIINEDGTYERLAEDSQPTNGVKGHNHHSIHICYKGGLGGVDTRTDAQKNMLRIILQDYKIKYKKAFILGHRDLSPDLNKDGKITKSEWVKICPCFSATEEYKSLNTI
jgi:N-acetyl-anhydromuramyl-L-alanine amidase AmpD